MVIVIGNPFARRAGAAVGAGGLPVAVATAAAHAGAAVQLVGKVGDGPDGDAIVLAVADAGVKHAALLRGAVPVRVSADDRPDVDASLDQLADLEGGSALTDEPEQRVPVDDLEAADLALGLSFLPDYRVVVVAQPLADDALAAVVDAARWAEARLIVVTAAATAVPELPSDATVFEAPAEDAEGAFATMLGRYAAALDGGGDPADAFAAASNAAGWSAVASERA